MKNTFLRCVVLLTSLVFAILAYACTLSDQQIVPTVSPDFNEVVFLTNEPCSAPCWQGLEIGVSTEDEVLATISALSFIDQKAVRIIPQSVPDLNPANWVQGKNIVAMCINRREPCLRLTIAEERLRDIDIELDYGLTLDEVINHFGNPDFVGSHPMGGDVIDCRVELMWVKQQLVVYSIFFAESEDIYKNCNAVDKDGTPSGQLKIAEVRYLPSEDIELRAESGRLTDFIETK